MFKIRRNDIEIAVSKIGGREKPYLWIQQGVNLYAVGHFRNDEAADLFTKVLDYVCFGNDEDQTREMLNEVMKD